MENAEGPFLNSYAHAGGQLFPPMEQRKETEKVSALFILVEVTVNAEVVLDHKIIFNFPMESCGMSS